MSRRSHTTTRQSWLLSMRSVERAQMTAIGTASVSRMLRAPSMRTQHMTESCAYVCTACDRKFPWLYNTHLDLCRMRHQKRKAHAKTQAAILRRLLQEATTVAGQYGPGSEADAERIRLRNALNDYDSGSDSE